MQLVSEPVEIVARAAYDEANARMGEYVRVRPLSADPESRTIRYTVDRSVNGEVKVGAKVRLVLAHDFKPKGRADGSVFYVDRYRVVGVSA